MNAEEKYSFDTLSVHAGQEEADSETRSRAVPIYQTASFLFEDAEQADRLFSLKEEGNIYSRISNPTNEVLEKRLAALEGGVGSFVTASGMAALNSLVFTLAQEGDNLVSSSRIYGGTHSYFRHSLPRYGIEVRFVEEDRPDDFRQAIDQRTKFLHVETIGNPTLNVPDLEALAEVAHDRHLPLVVDNTFATPSLCRPFEYGADVVWHSTTKWLNGHGTTIGGAVVDCGEFPWTEGDFPSLTEADPTYHGLNFQEEFGKEALIKNLKARAARDLGSNQSPFESFLTLGGLETLPLRMQRHCENAEKLARFLSDHPKVSWVSYPGLENHPTHESAKRYLDGGFGGMIAFGLEGGFQAGQRLIESVELISFLANVGDAKSLIIHPASTTHRQLSKEEREEAGVRDDLIRFSVGIEDFSDIRDDLERALKKV